MAGLGQRAGLLLSACIKSQSDRRSPSFPTAWSRSVSAGGAGAPHFMLTEEDNAVRWKNTFATTKWNMGSVPPRLRQRGVVLNPGAGRCPRADGEMSVCACWARVVKKIRACLTDTRGSFSSDNNSLMNVCAVRELERLRPWIAGRISRAIDRILNSRVTETNTEAMWETGRPAAVSRMFSGLIIEGLLRLIICSTSVYVK